MRHTLDLKDKRILHELDRNCRQSYVHIAKKVGLSKTAVINRINNMEKEGLIKGYSAVIDYGKIGFHNFRIFINLQNYDLEKEKEIIDFLKEQKIVSWIAIMEGQYNLGIRAFTRNINEMNNLWKELKKRYVSYFNQRLIVLNIQSNHYFRDYISENKRSHCEINSSIEQNKKKLDETEKIIIDLLSENAKIQIIDISKKAKSTPKTIISRIRNLEKERVILNYRAIINSEKMSLRHFKLSISTFNSTKKSLKDLFNYIQSCPKITSREETLGGEDIELDLEVENILELEKVINELRRDFGNIIQDYQIHHIVKEHKNTFFEI